MNKIIKQAYIAILKEKLIIKDLHVEGENFQKYLSRISNEPNN